jgi:hypothetical protein
MYKAAKLLLSSYQPDQIEVGMMFAMSVKINDYSYLHVHKLDKLPRDIDRYITENGYPVKPYIMALEQSNPDLPERILAYPDQIKWINYGIELFPFEIEDINYIMMNHEGYVGIWMEDDYAVVDNNDGTVELTFITSMMDEEIDEDDDIELNDESWQE